MQGLGADMAAVIDRVAARVEVIHKDEATGHDWQHIFRVRNVAERLGREDRADIVIVILSALQHDLDDRKVTGDISTEDALPNARAVMAESGVPQDIVETVCATIRMIGFHRTLDGAIEQTLEARIVSDADQLDAIGYVGVARTVAYGAAKGRLIFEPTEPPMKSFTRAQYDSNRGSTINHLFEKLLLLRGRMHTRAGRIEAEVRHRRMIDFLDGFFEEVSAAAEWRDLVEPFRKPLPGTPEDSGQETLRLASVA